MCGMNRSLPGESKLFACFNSLSSSQFHPSFHLFSHLPAFLFIYLFSLVNLYNLCLFLFCLISASSSFFPPLLYTLLPPPVITVLFACNHVSEVGTETHPHEQNNEHGLTAYRAGLFLWGSVEICYCMPPWIHWGPEVWDHESKCLYSAFLSNVTFIFHLNQI